MPATRTPDPRLIAKTHAAMFDMWFPLDELPLPPDAKPEITAIAAKVNAGMFEGFSNTLVMAILTAMTYPGYSFTLALRNHPIRQCRHF